MDFVAQRLPRDLARPRQSTNDNIRSCRNQWEQFEGDRLETTPNEIAFHSVTHILCDDKAETNRNTGDIGLISSAFSHIKNGMRTDNAHTAPNDALIVTAARNAIYVSEHENPATTKSTLRVRCDPCDGEHRGWRGPHGCASAGGSRAPWRDGGCSAGKFSCS